MTSENSIEPPKTLFYIIYQPVKLHTIIFDLMAQVLQFLRYPVILLAA